MCFTVLMLFVKILRLFLFGSMMTTTNKNKEPTATIDLSHSGKIMNQAADKVRCSCYESKRCQKVILRPLKVSQSRGAVQRFPTAQE